MGSGSRAGGTGEGHDGAGDERATRREAGGDGAKQ